MACVIPVASARGFLFFDKKPPAGAGGMTRGDYERGGWANARMGTGGGGNGRMVMARGIPVASARGFWVESACGASGLLG